MVVVLTVQSNSKNKQNKEKWEKKNEFDKLAKYEEMDWAY